MFSLATLNEQSRAGLALADSLVSRQESECTKAWCLGSSEWFAATGLSLWPLTE